MLPQWVQLGEDTQPFLDWLLGTDIQPWERMDSVIIKVPQKNFLYLYHAIKSESQLLRLSSELEFAGLFCKCNYGLYDVSEPLKSGLGIPEEITFQGKEETIKLLEQQMKEKIADLITNHWDEVLRNTKYKTRELLPMLKREEVRRMAEGFYLDGIATNEVVYKPDFTFGGEISDQNYLLYLERGMHTVNAMAMYWVRKHMPELSKQRILFGCIREEMQQIEANGRLMKIRLMRESLAGLEEETVLVKFCIEGKTICVRMKASALTVLQGRIPLHCLAARERAQLKKMYGNLASAGLQVEDVQSVSWNRKILYAADGNQEAA